MKRFIATVVAVVALATFGFAQNPLNLPAHHVEQNHRIPEHLYIGGLFTGKKTEAASITVSWPCFIHGLISKGGTKSPETGTPLYRGQAVNPS